MQGFTVKRQSVERRKSVKSVEDVYRCDRCKTGDMDQREARKHQCSMPDKSPVKRLTRALEGRVATVGFTDGPALVGIITSVDLSFGGFDLMHRLKNGRVEIDSVESPAQIISLGNFAL
jgi:hypothetical protein